MSDNVWVVHGVSKGKPCLAFLPNRGAALEFLKDALGDYDEVLAVMEVEGIDYSAVSVGAVLTLGWVQDLV